MAIAIATPIDIPLPGSPIADPTLAEDLEMPSPISGFFEGFDNEDEPPAPETPILPGYTSPQSPQANERYVAKTVCASVEPEIDFMQGYGLWKTGVRQLSIGVSDRVSSIPNLFHPAPQDLKKVHWILVESPA